MNYKKIIKEKLMKKAQEVQTEVTSEAIKNAAKDAMIIQDASNLSGVVHSWSRHMNAINDESRRLGKGTDWVNNHPVNILFADKVADMTGRGDNFGDAYTECAKLSGEIK